METSLVYSHIAVYRLIMNVLYGAKYRRRFRDITDLIPTDTQSVCDLCFGDTIIADWCRRSRIQWTGIDVNSRFCDRARRKGFDVLEGDLFSVNVPAADVFVMAGSLYHFHRQLPQLFELIGSRTSRFILSEPVRNLSSRRGVLGWYARRSANPGDHPAEFRYNEETLLKAVGAHRARHGFEMRVVSVGRDMLLLFEREPDQQIRRNTDFIHP